MTEFATSFAGMMAALIVVTVGEWFWERIKKAIKEPTNPKRITTGVRVVFGVPKIIKPITGLPEGGRIRLRFRAGKLAEAYRSTPIGIARYYIRIAGDGQWVAIRNAWNATVRDDASGPSVNRGELAYQLHRVYAEAHDEGCQPDPWEAVAEYVRGITEDLQRKLSEAKAEIEHLKARLDEEMMDGRD